MDVALEVAVGVELEVGVVAFMVVLVIVVGVVRASLMPRGHRSTSLLNYRCLGDTSTPSFP